MTSWTQSGARRFPTACTISGAISGGCGVSLNGQESRQAPAPKTSAEQNLWTIGIYTGLSPFELSAPSNVKNPVLTGADVTDMKDLNVDTVAHPFLVAVGSRYYVFFTTKDLKADKGGIGRAESKDGFEWKFRRTVIHGVVVAYKNGSTDF